MVDKAQLAVDEPEAYPEHDKLRAVKDRSQACGEFLEFLGEKGLILAEYPEDGERLVPAQYRAPALLAEFFDIDEDKLEEEKRKMLDTLRTHWSVRRGMSQLIVSHAPRRVERGWVALIPTAEDLRHTKVWHFEQVVRSQLARRLVLFQVAPSFSAYFRQ